MKKINLFREKFLLLFILLVPSFIHAQTEEKPKYAPGKEKHRNKTDELGRKQGTWMTFNSFGEKISETDWVNDRKEGMDKKYYKENKIKEEQEYLGGIKEGTYNKYFFSGQVAIEGQYVNGRKDGKWNKYFEDGSIRQEGAYKNGKKDGVWKFYNRKGVVTSQSTYKEDLDSQATDDAKKKADDKKAADNKKTKTPAGKSSTPKSDVAPVLPVDSIKKK